MNPPHISTTLGRSLRNFGHLWLTLWRSYGQCHLMRQSWNLPSRCASKAPAANGLLFRLRPVQNLFPILKCTTLSPQDKLLLHCCYEFSGRCSSFFTVVRAHSKHFHMPKVRWNECCFVLEQPPLANICLYCRTYFFLPFSLEEGWKWYGWNKINWRQAGKLFTVFVLLLLRKKKYSAIQTMMEVWEGQFSKAGNQISVNFTKSWISVLQVF